MASPKDLTITIPFPRPTQNVYRGYKNTDKAPETRPTTVRFTDDDRFKIDKVANSLGMSFGEFVRWCAAYGAIATGNELHKQSFETTRRPVVDMTGFK